MATIKVLVDLDAIMDTRLAVAERLKPGLAVELMSLEWDSRTTDSLIWTTGGFTAAEYKEAYGRRDHVDLQNSFRTGLLTFVFDELKETIYTGDVERGTIDYGLHINTYPYVLSKSEAVELEGIVRILVPAAKHVELEYIKPYRISNTWLLANEYTHYYTYDINLWLKKHIAELITNPTPRITVIGPQLREGDIEQLDDRERELAMVITPWEAMEHSLSLYCVLRYIDIEWFCLDSSAVKKGRL